jgi:hypothetical protein
VLEFQKMTLGCEYEFGDVWRTDLPQGLTWNEKDYSIVSSTGIANDPRGKVYQKGGEINTIPTGTVEQQLEMFEQLLRAHPEAAINHRTNLHLHVRIPGLSQDLPSLKKLLSYVESNQGEIYRQIEPIPVPLREEFVSEESFKGALKRWKRRKVSHQHRVPTDRVERALRASSVGEFLAAHAPIGKNGKPAWGLTTRAGINLLQLKETDTVEFRHFTNTLSPFLLESCFVWAKNFIPMALDNASVPELLSAHDYQFPKFAPYNHAMELGYQYTNFDKNSRKVAEHRINSLREILDIDNCTAEETVESIAKLPLD